jgi:hypothetical protein
MSEGRLGCNSMKGCTAVNNTRTRLVILLLGTPQMLEGTERSKESSQSIFALMRGGTVSTFQ